MGCGGEGLSFPRPLEVCHAPESIWAALTGLGGAFGGGGHKGGTVDLGGKGRECDEAHCMKFPNNKSNMLWVNKV